MKEIYCPFCGEELEIISRKSRILYGCECNKSIGVFWDEDGNIYGASGKHIHKYALESKAYKRYKKEKENAKH